MIIECFFKVKILFCMPTLKKKMSPLKLSYLLLIKIYDNFFEISLLIGDKLSPFSVQKNSKHYFGVNIFISVPMVFNFRDDVRSKFIFCAHIFFEFKIIFKKWLLKKLLIIFGVT